MQERVREQKEPAHFDDLCEALEKLAADRTALSDDTLARKLNAADKGFVEFLGKGGKLDSERENKFEDIARKILSISSTDDPLGIQDMPLRRAVVNFLGLIRFCVEKKPGIENFPPDVLAKIKAFTKFRDYSGVADN